jgi:hypothetical protein
MKKTINLTPEKKSNSHISPKSHLRYSFSGSDEWHKQFCCCQQHGFPPKGTGALRALRTTAFIAVFWRLAVSVGDWWFCQQVFDSLRSSSYFAIHLGGTRKGTHSFTRSSLTSRVICMFFVCFFVYVCLCECVTMMSNCFCVSYIDVSCVLPTMTRNVILASRCIWIPGWWLSLPLWKMMQFVSRDHYSQYMEE